MITDPLFDVGGKVALVTGASSGLGESFSRCLAARGAVVVAAARRVDRLQALVREGGATHAVALDVTDPASVDSAMRRVEELAGPIDILVNNAGIADTKASLEVSESDWRRVLDTNLDGAWRMAQAAAKSMVAAKRGGSIVNIASILGLRQATHLLAYAAAKAALVQVTKSLALEWARHGIRVNAIAPGYVVTEMNRDFFASDPGQAVLKRIPQRRVGDPRDLEGALLLLASGAGAYITGSVVVVDGGHLVNSL
ncbi:MAG TPA: glucose 1-dehydrogenase [Usitatibacteraceae bacterium]|nr:glucose 1-dehydrogenase [Usitatibacteraceae bacterium]